MGSRARSLTGGARRVVRPALALVWMLAMSTLSRPGFGASEVLLLEIERTLGAENCPDAHALAGFTNDTMGRVAVTSDPSGATMKGTRIVVVLTHVSKGYIARIRLVGERTGERVLTDPAASCTELSQAVAVTLAVMLDAATPVVSSAASAASAAPAAVNAPIDRPKTSSSVTRAAGLELGIAANAGLSVGTVGNRATIFSADFEATVRQRLRFVLGAILIPSQRFEVPSSGGGEVEVSLLGASIGGCLTLVSFDEAKLVSASACATGILGSTRGRSAGLAQNGESTRRWLGAGASLRLDGRAWGRLGWNVRAGTVAPLGREGFGVEGAGVVYQPAMLGFFLGVGATAQIL